MRAAVDRFRAYGTTALNDARRLGPEVSSGEQEPKRFAISDHDGVDNASASSRPRRARSCAGPAARLRPRAGGGESLRDGRGRKKLYRYATS